MPDYLPPNAVDQQLGAFGPTGTDAAPQMFEDPRTAMIANGLGGAAALGVGASFPGPLKRVLGMGAALPAAAVMGQNAVNAYDQMQGRHPLQLQQEKYRQLLEQAGALK